MKAKSIKGNSLEEIKTALEQSMADGYKPTLAIVFMSVKQDLEKVVAIMDQMEISLFGVTTAGEFIDGEIGQGSIVAMLLDLNPEYYKVILRETGTSTTEEISREIGREGKKLFSNPSFIIGSGGVYTDGEKIVSGIEDVVGKDVTLYGCMAGDDLNITETFAFSNGKITNNGLVAIVIDEDKISMNGLATCGWKPVGTLRTATKSKGSEVFTIDDEPALDLVLKYLGIEFDLDSPKDVVLNIGAYFPLQLERENAEPVMRTVMFINKQKRSLICAGNVPQGSKLRFSLPPDFDVINKVEKECVDLKESKQNQADAMIIFSCISRYLSFGELASQEIERIKDVWGAPMVGFFSAGEIGKSKKGKNEFHNNTCCIVVLKEKEK